jgi:hypothetical protein
MSRIIPLLGLAILLGGCVLPIVTEPHLHGRVLDARTKKAVAGAHVGIDGAPGIATTTLADGTFDFPAVRKWEVLGLVPLDHFPRTTVVVTAPGYAAARRGREDYERQAILLQPK